MELNKKDSFIKAGIVNLTIVALIGTLMRYKIGFEFPFFNQNNLLHAHSHYAFSGWVTHILFTLMVIYLGDHIRSVSLYYRLLTANLICAAGMLVSFAIQGYGAVSIFFGIQPEFGELSIDHFVETYARHGHGHIQQIQIALRTSSVRLPKLCPCGDGGMSVFVYSRK